MAEVEMRMMYRVFLQDEKNAPNWDFGCRGLKFFIE